MRKTISLLLVLLCVLQGASVFAYATEDDQDDQDDQKVQEITEETAGEQWGDDDAPVGEALRDLIRNDEKDDEPDPEAAIGNDGSARLVFADESILEYTQNIYFSYLETGAVLNSWSFPYSDRFFEIPSSQFSDKMAQGSLGLAVSAFRSTRFEEQYETYLHQAGFYNLYPFGYDKPTGEDTISGIIGMKEIGGRTVIAAVTCGQGYKKEWAGNMKIGKGYRHQGFSTGARKLERHLADFIEKNNIEGDKVLWITGMSRAAAIANITAADAIQSGEYDDVYAYLFGVPRVTKKPVKYPGIYNICGQYDAVPAIPMQSWGYERYGIDLYTPSQEADDSFPLYALEADAVGNALDGKGFRNNPEVNYQLRLIIEFMSELFDGSDDYVERFQDIMVRAVNRHGDEEAMEILTDAFRTLKPKNKKEQKRIMTAVDYISYIVAQHMRADQRQINDGSWDPTESLNSNLMLEHRPSTYVKWAFSDLYPEEKYMSPIESRRVTVNGKVDVVVYEGDYALTGINKYGRVYAPDPDVPPEISGEHSIFAMRNGDETIVNLPNDYEYSLVINADDSREVSYLDVIVTPENLVPENVTIHMMRLTNGGTVMMDAVPGKPLTEPEVLRGNYHHVSDTEYTYSPTVIMRNELQATKGAFLSLGTAITLLRFIGVGLGVMLIVCAVIGVRHRRKVKKGEHAPYSNLYVIIPHIICIVVAAAMTQFSTFFLFTVPAVRAQCATITMIFITLLSIRGFLRSKKPMAFLVAVLMGMLAYCTREFFNDTDFSTFSVINMLAYFSLIAALTGIACWTFRSQDKDTVAGLGKMSVEEGTEEEEAEAKAEKKPDEKKAEAKAEKKPAEKKAKAKTDSIWICRVSSRNCWKKSQRQENRWSSFSMARVYLPSTGQMNMPMRSSRHSCPVSMRQRQSQMCWTVRSILPEN